MNIVKYKYYITYSYTSTVATIEVFPLGVDKLTIQYTGEEGQIFKRRFLNGSLVFRDQPLIPSGEYTLFKNIDASIYDKCTEIKLEIKRSCDNGVTYVDDFWNGYFSVTDGEFDLDRCTFTVDCEPDDEYRCFVENKDTEIALAAAPQTQDATVAIPGQYEFFTCNATLGYCNGILPAPSAAWLIFHQEVCDGSQAYVYYREVRITVCLDGVATAPSGAGWVQDTSYGDCTNGFSKWVRTPVDVVTNNPNPDVWAGNCIDGGDTPPPKRIYLGVVKGSGVTTPAIVGKGTVYSNLISNHSEFYSVKYPKANATYQWAVTGAGLTIVGSSTSTTVEIDINCVAGSLGRSVDLIETTSCGASATVSQALIFTTGNPLNNSNVAQFGSAEICIGETALYTLNTETGKSCVVTGGTGTATFNAIDNKTIELTGLTAGTITLAWQGGNFLDANNNPVISVTVKVKKEIEPIYGDAAVCKTSQAYYSIPDTDLGGFVWEVDGGTITSGQGTNEILVTWDGNAGIGYVYVSQDFNCGCNWVQISECYPGVCSWWWCVPDDNYTFTNISRLFSTIDYMNEIICPGMPTLVSDFFGWNPAGDTPGYVAGVNYVTGLPNKLTNLSILSARAVLYGLTSDAKYSTVTPKEVLQWSDIEEILREVFNAYWFIENGYLRIEHISWFNRTVTYDLTDAYYNKYLVGKNIYNYNKIKAPRIERFKWKDASIVDFTGADITYAGTCTTNEPSQFVSNRGANIIQTDLINMQALGTDANSDGFVLLQTDSNSVVQSEQGLISEIIYPNAHLGWANLHYNYHRYNRVLLNGTMNLQDTVFLSSVKYKMQEGVYFPYCCGEDINPLTDLITTLVGNGVIEEAEHDLKKDIITVTLAHDL